MAKSSSKTRTRRSVGDSGEKELQRNGRNWIVIIRRIRNFLAILDQCGLGRVTEHEWSESSTHKSEPVKRRHNLIYSPCCFKILIYIPINS